MSHITFKAFLVFSLLVSTSFSAEEPQRDKLQATIDAALDVLYSDCSTDLSVSEKETKVRDVVEAKYDLDVIIRRAIGRNWQLMSESQQTRVLELVKQLVLKAYVKGLDGKTRPKITLGEVIKVSDKRMEIKSTAVLDGQTYYVLYRLGRMATGWQIYDIVAENVSVVSNYREQIDDHFRKAGSAELITRLEELLKKDTIDANIQI